MGMTQAGVILGTAAYMAPEQARGKTVDRRADIWAFGVVLYEMLTGQRLFKGDDLSETLASVIKDEPKLERVPAKVQRLLRSCLEKDPKQRLQAIGDWSLLLEKSRPGRRRKCSRHEAALRVPAGVLARRARGARTSVPLSRETPPVERPLVRLDVDLGADVSLPAPSSSGSKRCHLSRWRRGWSTYPAIPSKLFTRRLDQPKATELPGTQGAIGPFFSPDGQWVGFVLGRQAEEDLRGRRRRGPARRTSPTSAGASWGEDGIILATDAPKGLLRVPAGGGPPETLAELAKGETGSRLPADSARRQSGPVYRARQRANAIRPPSRCSRWRIATGRSWPEAAHPPAIWPRPMGLAI